MGLCAWDLMACAVLLETWLGVGVKRQLWCKAWKKCDGHDKRVADWWHEEQRLGPSISLSVKEIDTSKLHVTFMNHS